MPYSVTINPGLTGIALPSGVIGQGGQTYTLTADEYFKLSPTAAAVLFSNVTQIGEVTSVNGSTGAVTLTAAGLGAMTSAAGTALTDRVTAVERYRRRDLPDPLLADALYTGAAPTITTAMSTTTSISGGLKYAPAGVTLSGSDSTFPFLYCGGGSFAIGATSPDTNYVIPLSRYPNTYASGQSNWALEFATDAQVVELKFKYTSATASMYRLSIDGRKVTDLMQSVGGTTLGNGHMLKVDLGSPGLRRWRFDLTTVPFGGIYVGPGASMFQVWSYGGRLGVLGDSITDGSALNTGGAMGTWLHRAARLLGCNDAWDQARGGTGYITPNTTAIFGDRVAGDILPYAFDRVIIWGGYNDNGGNQSTISTAAAGVYSAIKAGLPSAQIYVVGCWAPTGSPGASIVNTNNTLKAAATAAGLPFISTLDGMVYSGSGTLVASQGAWITGTGRVGATTGTGNADTYIGTDSTHPTDAGHAYIARRMVGAISMLMPA